MSIFSFFFLVTLWHHSHYLLDNHTSDILCINKHTNFAFEPHFKPLLLKKNFKTKSYLGTTKTNYNISLHQYFSYYNAICWRRPELVQQIKRFVFQTRSNSKSKRRLNLTKAKVSYCLNSSLVKHHNRLDIVKPISSFRVPPHLYNWQLSFSIDSNCQLHKKTVRLYQNDMNIERNVIGTRNPKLFVTKEVWGQKFLLVYAK